MTTYEKLKIKWSGKDVPLTAHSLNADTTIAQLQDILYQETKVLPKHQKLLGVKSKNPTHDTLGSLKVKPAAKLMMMGSAQAEIEKVQAGRPDDVPEVFDDFDDDEYEGVDVKNDPIYLEKVARRTRDYPIKILNKPREGAKLLVLDIDYTFFDHRTPAESIRELQRPYLHEFLERAYKRGYDIIIWSATNMKWIDAKLGQMGLYDEGRPYKIVCQVCHLGMIDVVVEGKGLKRVKPLGTIWGKEHCTKDTAEESFDDYMRPNDHEKASKSGPPLGKYYSHKNTIMFDDVQRNFIMNPENGLRIRPFRNGPQARFTDNELNKLADFLDKIYDTPDFTTLNLSKWERYLR